MNNSITSLFYIKKSKLTIDGLCPIFVRITIKSQRWEFSTGLKTAEKKWCNKSTKISGTSDATRLKNEQLKLIASKIVDTEKVLYLTKQEVTIQTFKNQFNGVVEKPRTLLSIFQDHNDRMEQLLGREYAPGTLERYKTSYKHTAAFLEWKYNISDIDIKSIDLAFINDYEFYLRTVRKCANNTAVKYIKNFNKIVKICLANDWLARDPFVNYKSKIVEVTREYLTEEEIQSLINKEFVIKRLELVRDIFLFSCFTGLAYIEVKNLTAENIIIGLDGGKWISAHRQKTGTLSKIPLLPISTMMLEKYARDERALHSQKLIPILSNQKMNSYLKEVAALCGINKELTFHIARHTFATSVTLSNGVPMESVSKMLGHRDIKTTQHYAKIIDRKISDDIQVLKNKFSNHSNYQNSIAKTANQ